MPTASTAQILGNTECFEVSKKEQGAFFFDFMVLFKPISSNIYSRSTLAGSFTVINHYLVEDLRKLNLWNAEMKNAIVSNGGSIQAIASIPQELKVFQAEDLSSVSNKFVFLLGAVQDRLGNQAARGD